MEHYKEGCNDLAFKQIPRLFPFGEKAMIYSTAELQINNKNISEVCGNL